MIRRIVNWFVRWKTKNYRRIPLFVVTLDYKKFKEEGKAGSCTVYNLHPSFMKDEYLQSRIQECIDHIRDNYDMEQVIKL